MEQVLRVHTTTELAEILMSKIKKVCVFASSSDYLKPLYYQEAKSLGELLGKNGFDIVYGGSTLGMMWACAQQVKNNGGKIYGVMPEKLVEMGCRTDNCDEFLLTDGMRERKDKMDKISDAVIALAGGFGTLEELSEMIVQKQLGYNKKTIVILNTDGFYDNLLRFFDTIISENFANKNTASLFYIANTPDEAVEYIKNYTEPDKIPSKHEIYSR